MRHGPPPEVIRCQHPGQYSWLEGKRREIAKARNDAKIAVIAAAAVERRKRRDPLTE